VEKNQQKLIAFEPFFTHILAHELMHGLGPHTITVSGTQTTVRQAMKELYSALEEAKADISGLFALQYLIDKGVVEKSFEKKMYATYLASTFRSVRFGTNDAHGKGIAVQCNFILDEGGFEVNKSGAFKVNFDKIKDAVRKLTSKIMTLQAEGDYDGAKKLLDTYGVVRPPMQNVLDRLKKVPTDIEPQFSSK
jgi:methylmalonyl-CoA mutase cobalamin-binding subunit